jgi:hypothetical protein
MPAHQQLSCCLLLLLVMQPLLANDTLQELVVAFYDQQGQLTSKVSFIIQVQDSNCSSDSSSSSSSMPSTSAFSSATTQP